MTLNAFLSLIVFILFSAAASLPGGLFRPGDWYRRLNKPSWCPPDWLFAPVWLVLYLAIAVSGWLIWQQADAHSVTLPLVVYAVHLVLNALWSTVFFGLRRLGMAFLEVICLWLSIVATIVLFLPIDPVAAYLLMPYAVWVGFAAALNLSLWRLNPQAAA